MKYEYNSNLTYEERISLVSKEITDYYPFISKSEAILIASLEHPIDDKITDIDRFRRLYNILLVKKDKDIFNIVLNDMMKLDKKNEIISNGIIKIVEYNKNNSFPSLEEIFDLQ